jgi:hypothetical protein
MAFYPLLYLSLLEVPRILYLPSARALAPLAFLAIFVLSNRVMVVMQLVRPGERYPHVAAARE